MKKFVLLSIMIGALIFSLSACMNVQPPSTDSSFNVVTASYNGGVKLIQFDTYSATILNKINLGKYEYPLAFSNDQLLTVKKYSNYWAYTGYSIKQSDFMKSQWSFDIPDAYNSYLHFVGFSDNKIALFSNTEDKFLVYSSDGSLVFKSPIQSIHFFNSAVDKNGVFYTFYGYYNQKKYESDDAILIYNPAANSTSTIALPFYGDIYDPHVIGQYLYFGTEKGLYFLKTQNATSLYYLPTAGTCFALNGFNNTLYAYDSQKGVDVINIATPTQAYIEATLPNMKLSSHSIIYKNKLITYADSNLVIYNLSDPSSPVEEYTTSEDGFYIPWHPLMSIQS